MQRHERPNPDTDPFRPPAIPTEVCCLHCGHEYESYLIHWQEERDDRGHIHGYWCCPTFGCDGKGFGFDIFPTDPEYRDEDGEPMWLYDDDEDEDGDDDDVIDEDDELAEAYDADELLAECEPFDLDLPPLPHDAPSPLESLEADLDDERARSEPRTRRRRFYVDEDDIPF